LRAVDSNLDGENASLRAVCERIRFVAAFGRVEWPRRVGIIGQT